MRVDFIQQPHILKQESRPSRFRFLVMGRWHDETIVIAESKKALRLSLAIYPVALTLKSGIRPSVLAVIRSKVVGAIK